MYLRGVEPLKFVHLIEHRYPKDFDLFCVRTKNKILNTNLTSKDDMNQLSGGYDLNLTFSAIGTPHNLQTTLWEHPNFLPYLHGPLSISHRYPQAAVLSNKLQISRGVEPLNYLNLSIEVCSTLKMWNIPELFTIVENFLLSYSYLFFRYQIVSKCSQKDYWAFHPRRSRSEIQLAKNLLTFYDTFRTFRAYIVLLNRKTVSKLPTACNRYR